MQVKKQQLELDMEQHTGSNRLIPKEYVLLGSILSPCLFNLYGEYIMRNAQLEVWAFRKLYVFKTASPHLKYVFYKRGSVYL